MGKKQTQKSVTRRSSHAQEKHTRKRDDGSSSREKSKKLSKSRTSGCTADDRNYMADLFPRKSVWIVFVITLCIRLRYVSKGENWWILHPDEIFQSVEVAHSELYGYGFRPYEYMPPLDGANTTTSVGRLQENMLGMYSLRSFLYPKLLAAALYVATLCGYTGSPMLFWKMFHTFVTSCLPIAVYTFTKSLYQSRDVAVLASVLSSTSVFLYVLGTHTLVNSFVSPFLFWSLVPLINLLVNKSESQNRVRTPKPEVKASISDTAGVTFKSKEISNKDKSTGDQEVDVENLQPEVEYYDECRKAEQKTMETHTVGEIVPPKNGNVECETTESTNCISNGGIAKPLTETTNGLYPYTTLPSSGNRLTKGIIYEIMHHCKEQSRLTMPYFKYRQNTFMSGDRKHVTYLEDTLICYDSPGIIEHQMGVDFNHNSSDLHKPNYEIPQQRNDTKVSEIENVAERISKSCSIVNDSNKTQENIGSQHHESSSIDKNICKGDCQSTNEIIGQSRPMPDIYDKNAMNGRQIHSPNERNEAPLEKELVQTVSADDRDCDVDSSRTSLFVNFKMTYLFSGFTLAMCIYIRADLLVFIAFLVLPYGRRMCDCNLLTSLPVLLYCIGLMAGLSFGIFDDCYSYRSLVISPWQWVNFNVIRDRSAIFFGTKHWSFYIRALFTKDEVMSACLVVSALTFTAMKCKKIRDHERFMTVNVRLFISLLAFFITHSLNSHKEVRFLHDFIVLLLTFYASFIVILIKTCKEYLIQNNLSQLSHSIEVAFVVYLCSSQWRYFPGPTSGWAYRGLLNTNHVNVCLDFLRQQNDVTGVFVDTSIHETGAFSTLHKNVPLIALIHKEFYEFEADSRLSLKSALSYLSRTNNLSLSVLTQVSDFISVYNTPYLLKTLINKPVYNYLVMSTDRAFIEVGFREVYRIGDMRILKRSFISEDEVKLKAIASRIQLGPNCKILNYEANWLLTFGQYDKAISKLSYSLELDKTNLQAHQLLMEVRRRQGDVTGARVVYKMCGQYHGHRSCTSRPGRITIHEEYNLNVDL
ncbi:uncharacterized protein LOC110463146 [Mizuhopecten yessoensis]|uniref:Mannosyltransferase n=1 Tax=Mizuhopecten yessoensis TaxID=6573 RepID=A0A210PWT7_MIZYE|nr:uncharacterized protein LOC110463146 [Mizuhopecten yessoensis]OWF40950.1 hypothetical protein KP79_PYT15977 [Mizuhopecten yessoensis]